MKGQKGSTNTTLAVIVVLIIVLLGIWYWTKGTKTTTPADNSASATLSETAALEGDLSATDVSVQSDIKDIDTATKGY